MTEPIAFYDPNKGFYWAKPTKIIAPVTVDVEPLPLYTQRTWVGLMRGVRVECDTVVISVKGGNDAARELCGALIEEMNR
jgi:hypothetical protein